DASTRVFASFIFNLSLAVSLQFFFFFTDPATTAIYTLSLHDALPIWIEYGVFGTAISYAVFDCPANSLLTMMSRLTAYCRAARRSEEHTSELQSQSNLVCRLLLEKKKNDAKRAPSQTQEIKLNKGASE